MTHPAAPEPLCDFVFLATGLGLLAGGLALTPRHPRSPKAPREDPAGTTDDG